MLAATLGRSPVLSRGALVTSSAMGDWFEALCGFPERGADVRSVLEVEDGFLVSPVNGSRYRVGAFSTPSLGELRAEVRALAGAAAGGGGQRSTFSNVLGDAAAFHDEAPRATFQVASQFNCLEFVGPSVTPEDGVTGYAHDRTQGPCCAIACGAATIYRNYFVRGCAEGGGQTKDSQIENLGPVLAALGPPGAGRFRVRGGYTLADDAALDAYADKLAALDGAALDALAGELRIGVQVGCQVTALNWGRRQMRDEAHVVTQVYGSACSVAYSRNDPKKWKPFALLVLRASYEATLLVAARNALQNPDDANAKVVYLTAIGGGVFGNPLSWIADAVRRALAAVDALAKVPLDVRLVTYAPPVPRHFADLAAERAAPAAAPPSSGKKKKRDRSPEDAPPPPAPL